uniref:Xaa-Pro dipeptidase n=1 Tax=Cacopsylla melanoneura TaxID=428564 RepID=A0A8D8V8X3_9HEMI
MEERKSTEPSFSKGAHTCAVPLKLFALNRSRLVEALNNTGHIEPNSFVLLQGGSSCPLYDTDVEYDTFRQESYFHWTFGVYEPDFYGVVDVKSGRSILFAPRLSEAYVVWMGHLPTLEEYKERYKVDEVHFVDEMVQVLQSKSPSVLLTLAGINTDSDLPAIEATFKGIEKFQTDNKILFPVIAECRVIKTDLELNVLRYASRISSEAHRSVMRKISPGMHEYQAEAIFKHYIHYVGGSRHVAYTCICASGCNGAVLHYGHASAPNDKQILDGDMLVFDMGSSYYGYASDITCSYPVNGKFTDRQANIYTAVLDANRAVMKAALPGVSWVDMHRLANQVVLTKLLEMGLLRGSVDELLEHNIGSLFQPHGLGHLLGIDVHDVGGYLPHCPPRPTIAGFKSLRFARKLKENMVLTIEPGCYFIPPILEKAFKDETISHLLNQDKLREFFNFGGVRIEDVVVIKATGVENLTDVPRTVQEIEKWMEKKQTVSA